MAYSFRIPSTETHPCPQCGQAARGPDSEDICSQCSFYRDNPEQAPKYWTWTQGPGTPGTPSPPGRPQNPSLWPA